MRPRILGGLLAVALGCTACGGPPVVRVTAADDGRVVHAMVGDVLQVDLGRGWTIGPVDSPQLHLRSIRSDGTADIELRRIGRATIEAERVPPRIGHWQLTVVVGADPVPIVS